MYKKIWITVGPLLLVAHPSKVEKFCRYVTIVRWLTLCKSYVLIFIEIVEDNT